VQSSWLSSFIIIPKPCFILFGMYCTQPATVPQQISDKGHLPRFYFTHLRGWKSDATCIPEFCSSLTSRTVLFNKHASILYMKSEKYRTRGAFIILCVICSRRHYASPQPLSHVRVDFTQHIGTDSRITAWSEEYLGFLRAWNGTFRNPQNAKPTVIS
jgi:hypothetical protein